MTRRKLCDLYDSASNPEGQATDITVAQELNGWKEISFTLPRLVNGEVNHRWDYIKSEYLLRYTKGDFVDWFILQEPNKSHSGLIATNTVKCVHVSSQLNKKNLYVEFDDENGIGTVQYLIGKALAGTGWSLGGCDRFLESDGVTEKVRSLKSNAKRGAYLLIQDICKLFNAYPVFHGDERLVDIFALGKRDVMLELNYGKNVKQLERKEDSDNIVTRLYVEGEYGDDGYVGIDEVNPTGLPFLLDFSYYKQIGSFTDAHQAALDKYLLDMRREKLMMGSVMTDIVSRESELNRLWGQWDYMLYVLQNGQIVRSLSGGTVLDEKRTLTDGDDVVILLSNGTHDYATYSSGSPLPASATHVIKRITRPSGLMGGKEVGVESKQQSIQSLIRQRDKATTEARREEYQRQIDAAESGIVLLYTGDADGDGLYTLMRQAVLLALEIADMGIGFHAAIDRQNEIETGFAIAIGDMLKDGYWSNNNYIVGQEDCLYHDALDMMAVACKPSVTYSVSAVNLAHLSGYEQERFELNQTLRLYDADLEVNDFVYITKLIERPAEPWNDAITISNDALDIGGKTLESILSRINEIAALIDQKNALYERARAIGKDGSIPMKRLEGTIDVLKTRLSSSVSNWYTDDNGNIVLESLDGKSAMKLCGDGFMIAHGKNEQDNWDWRTFGTGEGFTAD